jgi:parallel beta-helix repeat protein
LLRILIPGSSRHIVLVALAALAGSALEIEARTIWVEDPCSAAVTPVCPRDDVLCPPFPCPIDPLFPPCPSGAPDNPFHTINAAMSVANFGDTIRVKPGLYCENVVVENGVRLRGSGASDTVIEGDGTDPVLIADLVDTGTVIQGFTITGGGGRRGAGIRADLGSPVINQTIIEGNVAVGDAVRPAQGGGIFLRYSNALITENVIRDNQAGSDMDENGGLGGGIFVDRGFSIISQNVIRDNIARASPDIYSTYLFGYGGGIELQRTSTRIADNTITGNRAGLGGGGIDVYGSSPTVVNNTIDGNQLITPPAAPLGFSYGGGMEIITLNSGDGPVIFNNLITNNEARDGGGGVDAYPLPGPPDLKFLENDVFGNIAIDDPSTNDYSGLQICSDASPNNACETCVDDDDCGGSSGSFLFCTLGAAGICGNVSSDPLYMDAPGSDYRLTASSPGLDVGLDAIREFDGGPDGDISTIGDNTLTFLIITSPEDLTTGPRSVDGDSDGVATQDLGALEFLPGPDGDRDNDGVPENGDGSMVPGDNPCPDGVIIGCDDNCPNTFNNGGGDVQADTDGDGVGDACDLCPLDPDPDQLDTDLDGLGDDCVDEDDDNDTILEDGDGSGTPGDNPCLDGTTTGCDDNCPKMGNSGQSDNDDDGAGNTCDCAPNDPTVQLPADPVDDSLAFLPSAPGADLTMTWGTALRAESYNVYRGSFSVLLGAWVYTQDPNALTGAEVFCGLLAGDICDLTTCTFTVTPAFAPPLGGALFFLVTSVGVCGETSLGETSAGVPRPFSSPAVCP